MIFLDGPFERHHITERIAARRKAIALRLLERFAETFGMIEYDLLWDVSTINSQAWRSGSKRRVTLFGGLVRHPVMTVSGIGLVLAHETGHHLGGLPLDPALRWPTWQGQADFWAASQGMPAVFASAARRHTLRGAKQIASLHEEFEEDEPDITPGERSEVFRAGAMGEAGPACLQAAFRRVLMETEADGHP
jgi:hypothetical protein